MSICSDQKKFNAAFQSAMQSYLMKSYPCNSVMTIVGIIMLVLYIYAIVLAMRVKDPNQRVLHILGALIFGPLYVLAYLLSEFKKR